MMEEGREFESLKHAIVLLLHSRTRYLGDLCSRPGTDVIVLRTWPQSRHTRRGSGPFRKDGARPCHEVYLDRSDLDTHDVIQLHSRKPHARRCYRMLGMFKGCGIVLYSADLDNQSTATQGKDTVCVCAVVTRMTRLERRRCGHVEVLDGANVLKTYHYWTVMSDVEQPSPTVSMNGDFSRCAGPRNSEELKEPRREWHSVVTRVGI